MKIISLFSASVATIVAIFYNLNSALLAINETIKYYEEFKKFWSTKLETQESNFNF